MNPDIWTAIGAALQLSGIILNLAPTTLTPGSYTLSNITVDATGQITTTSNGPGTGGSPRSTTTISCNTSLRRCPRIP